MHRILVVNVNWLGDAIFSTPVFKALKQAYPKAHVACLCVPRVEEVLRHCPHIDEIIVYDEDGKDRFLWNKIRLILNLRSKQFSAAFLLHRSMTRGLLVYLAGIPKRIGFCKVKALLTDPIEAVSVEMHRRDYYLRVVEGYGIACRDRSCQLQVADLDIARMNERLNAKGVSLGDKIIVFNTGGNWDLKRWPLSSWERLTQHVSEHLDLRIVFSGAEKDRDNVRQIIAHAGVNAVDLSSQICLGELLALFKRASIVVSGDSGPLHLAQSVGAKTVGIFGPTRPEITGLTGVGEGVILFKDIGCNKAPCYHLTCKNNLCMQAIEVQDVFKALQKFVS